MSLANFALLVCYRIFFHLRVGHHRLCVGHRGEIMTVRRSLSLARDNDCFGLRLDGLSLRLS
jgi:hypothetical protein